MPVYFKNDSEQLDAFDYVSIESDPFLRESREKFLANKRDAQNSIRCLYVGQRERATVTSTDPYIDVIGSDDATTCHIVLVVDEVTNNSCLCHFDGQDTTDGFRQMINSLEILRPPAQQDDQAFYSLYIVGGFLDSRKYSIELTMKLFKTFIKCPKKLSLKLCVVTKLNDCLKNDRDHYPIAYGFGYDVKKREIFVCNKFLDKGPDLQARSGKHFSTNKNMNIYDTLEFKLTIGPFEYRAIEHVEQMINLSDHILLQHFSTSPKQEPPDFVHNLKRTFQFMIDYPTLIGTYFKSNKPHCYTKEIDGSWKSL